MVQPPEVTMTEPSTPEPSTPEPSAPEPTPARAPMGHPAEAETPIHDLEPRDHDSRLPLEETEAYELAVEDGAPLAPTSDDLSADDRGQDDNDPVFQEPTAP
jgi:hypothetical protein